MLAGIEIWLKFTRCHVLAKLVAAFVEDVEALIQLGGAVAPETYPLSIGAIVEVVSHAQIGGACGAFPENVVVLIVA